MKRFLMLISAVLALVCVTASCGYKEPPEIGFHAYEQFSGYKLGYVKGQVDDKMIKERVGNPELISYSTSESALEALRDKKIHGVVLPATDADSALNGTDFKRLEDTLDERKLCAVMRYMPPENNTFAMQINASITLMESDGTAKKISRTHSPSSKKTQTESPVSHDYEKVSGRKLTVGICSADAFPYNYRDESGNLVGINTDTAYAIAADLKAELVIKEYPEDKLIDALVNGDVDVIFSQFTEPSEDEEIDSRLSYSHPYYDDSTYILINNPVADLMKD